MNVGYIEVPEYRIYGCYQIDITDRIRDVYRWPGGHSEGATPDPIPNSAVKTLSADGTAS